jgi:hypothetical protein
LNRRGYDSGELDPRICQMNPAEFKQKWTRYSGKETSAYQEHFNDLCRLLGQPTPAQADPTGSENFCFQKRVVKDAELFAFDDVGRVEENPETERGFVDVWKRDCFAWEYKGKKKNLDDANRQLLRYRESLLNPPLLIVCDFDRYIIRTNFNGTVQETHEFTNAQIDEPRSLSPPRLVRRSRFSLSLNARLTKSPRNSRVRSAKSPALCKTESPWNWKMPAAGANIPSRKRRTCASPDFLIASSSSF